MSAIRGNPGEGGCPRFRDKPAQKIVLYPQKSKQSRQLCAIVAAPEQRLRTAQVSGDSKARPARRSSAGHGAWPSRARPANGGKSL
jgi:hypothetical protein